MLKSERSRPAHETFVPWIMRPLLLLVLALPILATAQQPPQLAAGVATNPRAQGIRLSACTVEEEGDDEPRTSELPSRQTPEWQAEYALRRAYRTLFPEFLAAVPLTQRRGVDAGRGREYEPGVRHLGRGPE
jgi:hypothetical protein